MYLIEKVSKYYRYLLCFALTKIYPRKYIVIKAFITKKKFNWGDDLNLVLLKFLTNKKVLLVPNCKLSIFFPIENYLVIGSTITSYYLKSTYIWGAGIINDCYVDQIKYLPKRVYAVRGPRTKQELNKLGIDCPEVYGDPALLMPRLYSPKVEKKYRLGIVPHYIDVDNEYVKSLLNEENTLFIRVQNYDSWNSFIDEICSCEVIISSSLHGLIIAEAYGVPCIWGEFGNYINGWEFKFYDFYESIGKYNVEPLVFDQQYSVKDICTKARTWMPGSIDLEKLISACPFIDSGIFESKN